MAKKKSDDVAALEQASPVVETLIQAPVIEENNFIPAVTSSEWSDYVMKQFTEDEIFDGNPTVDGLRRVAELLVGEIVDSRAHSVACPGGTRDNKSATAECTIVFRCGDENNYYFKTYTEIADVTMANTDEIYATYPSATAATRAEGRALRKALKLKRVVAAEEVKELTVEESEDPNRKIAASQINFMRIVGRHADVDIIKFINSGTKQYKHYKDIAYDTAVKMLAKLSEYKRVLTSVPPELKGYKADWISG